MDNTEYISRQTVLRCIKESRDGIDWGQSEDGDAFLHYSAALYRTVASEKCVPAADIVVPVRCKDCIHNNDCDIQYSAQAGEHFFCGFGETEKDVREDVYK